MSEAVVVIAENLGRRSDKAPWAAKDGNGQEWKRWDQSWDPFIGKRLKLTYEVKSREWQGRTFEDNIVSAHELAEESPNGDEPKLGTGDYIKGQSPPIEARRYCALNAANNATTMTESLLSRQTAREITPELYRATWDAMHWHCFQQNLRACRIMEDEDIPL